MIERSPKREYSEEFKHQRLIELTKENKQLRIENDILKQTALTFAQRPDMLSIMVACMLCNIQATIAFTKLSHARN
ncbi:MAG: hypothetical protein FWF98_06110 [Dehalococcoidia bacterium]|nr:hypothetical protein [Dehalococcoidia bacterium]